MSDKYYCSLTFEELPVTNINKAFEHCQKCEQFYQNNGYCKKCINAETFDYSEAFRQLIINDNRLSISQEEPRNYCGEHIFDVTINNKCIAFFTWDKDRNLLCVTFQTSNPDDYIAMGEIVKKIKEVEGI